MKVSDADGTESDPDDMPKWANRADLDEIFEPNKVIDALRAENAQLRERAEKAEAELLEYKPCFPGKSQESELSQLRSVVGLFKRYAASAHRQWERTKAHLAPELAEQIRQLEEMRSEPIADLRRRIVNQRRELASLNKLASEWGDYLQRAEAAEAALADARERIAELEASLREVIHTGLNGGNNVRLAFIAASQRELSPANLAFAQKSEDAVKRAYELLGDCTASPPAEVRDGE